MINAIKTFINKWNSYSKSARKASTKERSTEKIKPSIRQIRLKIQRRFSNFNLHPLDYLSAELVPDVGFLVF